MCAYLGWATTVASLGGDFLIAGLDHTDQRTLKVISPPSLFASNMSVILVLDLSKPEELWNTMEMALKQVREGGGGG